MNVDLKKILKFSCFVFLLQCFSLGVGHCAGDAAKGKEIYSKKCVTCHGNNGEGKASQKAPRLAQQFDWYIVTQLKNFKEKKRLNPTMLPFLNGLTEKDFEDLGAYISSLK